MTVSIDHIVAGCDAQQHVAQLQQLRFISDDDDDDDDDDVAVTATCLSLSG